MMSRWEMKGLGEKRLRDRIPLVLMNWPRIPARRFLDGKAIACQQLVLKIEVGHTDSGPDGDWGRKEFIRHVGTKVQLTSVDSVDLCGRRWNESRLEQATDEEGFITQTPCLYRRPELLGRGGQVGRYI